MNIFNTLCLLVAEVLNMCNIIWNYLSAKWRQYWYANKETKTNWMSDKVYISGVGEFDKGYFEDWGVETNTENKMSKGIKETKTVTKNSPLQFKKHWYTVGKDQHVSIIVNKEATEIFAHQTTKVQDDDMMILNINGKDKMLTASVNYSDIKVELVTTAYIVKYIDILDHGFYALNSCVYIKPKPKIVKNMTTALRGDKVTIWARHNEDQVVVVVSTRVFQTIDIYEKTNGRPKIKTYMLIVQIVLEEELIIEGALVYCNNAMYVVIRTQQIGKNGPTSIFCVVAAKTDTTVTIKEL